MAFGLHYSDTILGRVFTQQSTPSGVALPLYTTTAAGTGTVCGMPLWNPPSSNRNVELMEAVLGYCSGSGIAGGIVIMGVPCSFIGAAGPVTALLSTSPVNQLVGSGNQSKVQSYSGAANSSLTMTAAGTTLPPSSTAAGPIRTIAGINTETTATPVGTIFGGYQFNGSLIVPPGYLIYLACTLATVALYCSSLTWKEIPINPGQS